MRRYEAPDDFGKPETAFNICTFWRIDALARIGRKDQAREIFEVMLARRNPLGPAVGGHRIRSPARCGAISRRPIRWSA